ncbi:hypothetical protein SBFV3_gp19 [Sulfolobales Beppu filamentous virus 3]|uniref:Uncharacterized protein n=1 Tax=Sulfolobales Beppu filamentous virus 3 TaxID=2493124 RepID=A0A3S8NF27_9VIRU|nr:hypothetical protein HOU83_gp19 [Sulfolobales Beppu filamentous virus 3]AZI75854.1 hypothetical protein SBFV3_gp19 [Sulfolobales Beppu filamentous virus 3]
MNGNIIKLRNIVQSVVNPSGIVKYNVVYIPKLGMYKITLVSTERAVPGKHIANLIEQLQNAGYTVMMKTSSAPFLRRHVITLYAIPNSGRGGISGVQNQGYIPPF